ncbi:peptidoglycan-binding protein [Pseudoxanthomonas sp. LH2527]|uniref:peptidoglycan-binding protein n=1 Tax=Pseudoxanthomonas sp. LH2527 TaxID=2923249 RepID=UPI001F13E5F2|nr:peptidoglycan-binding protein [Pseudoxanthomonas sp. LH2527]MCH6482396.1 peptidoglycan-binding protein [Pseudoxanthomonas sp. LH2527]
MASEYTRDQILDIIERQAQASGIPREDFLRFAYIETGGRFNPDASNPSGAKGLFQFMPRTAEQYGIAGREFDPAASTRAAAELYGDNLADIARRQSRSGHDFLSGQETPSGLDLYLAHQQGAAGYASIQSAMANGEFTRDDTRRNILNNISARDVERLTGHSADELRGLDDRALATTFSEYWNTKYAAISIPDRGIQASQPDGAVRERTSPLADGVLQSGERGEEVRALQTSLNQLGFRDGQGAELETRSGIYGGRTQDAVRAFQTANQLEATGSADARTRDAIAQQLALPEQERNLAQPGEAQPREGGLAWPTPGNRDINEADKPREGRGEFGTARSGGRRHGGIDIQGDVGDPVVAVAGGTVVVRPNNGAAGNTVHVRHDDGSLTKYFHLDEFSVRNGQRVEAGQQIGTMGRTGNTPAQGDTHLHFEMWRDGRQVDPMPHLRVAERDAAVPARAATPEVLRDGASGAPVRELQQQLNQLGYRGADGKPLETASGMFGPQTEHALRAFQADRGLKVDGEYGDRSREALVAATRDSARDPAATGAVPQARNEDAQRSFVDRMFAAMHGGDDRGMRQALDDYLKTPAGESWRKEAPTIEPSVTGRDPTGPAR